MIPLRWQFFQQNFHGRDFVVGDIHGYFNVLDDLLNSLKFDGIVDRLFLSGDMIDRGPFSYMVLSWLDKPYVFALEGNHERMCQEYYSGQSWQASYSIHGGDWFINLPNYDKLRYIKAFEKLPSVFEIDIPNGKRIGIVHAEVPTDDWLEFKYKFDDYAEDALWSFIKFEQFKNNKSIDRVIDNIDYVIHGHSSVPTLMQGGNVLYIDTGALSKKLTILEINNPNGIIAYH